MSTSVNPKGKPKILIVDDEPDILKTLETILRGEEFEVKSAHDGKEAISVFKSESFDLVITDMKMPGMKGTEVVREIKQLDEDVEVIILTGFASIDSAIKALRDDGAFDYLTKPLEDIDELILGVNRAIEKRRLRLDNKKKTKELAKANEKLRIEIKERKCAEDAFRKSEEKYRILVENASDAIFIVQDDVIKFPNPKTNAIMGYSSEELAKIHFADLIYPDDRDMILDALRKWLGGKEVPGSYTCRMINRAGEELWVQLNLVLLSWEGLPAILSILRDFTQQKRLEGQLLQAQKMDAIGTLAGGMAHDFNNLLMGIQGNASLILLDVDSSSPYYEMLENIEQYVQNGAALTKQLLGFARGGKYEVRPIDINELLVESATMFGRTKKEIHIHTKLQNPPPVVAADRRQIEQALLNLYVNAWQAMPGGGRLYLETKIVTLDDDYCKPYQAKPGRYAKVSVTDTGIGMDKSTCQRIFDPFFTTKEKVRGTGLGLSSAYGIIKNHAGIISVYSEVGQGSTFNIYLPVSSAAAYQNVPAETELVKGSETILLVDDEEMIIKVGQALLEKLGYRVFAAENGEQAVDTIKRKGDDIDLVILDMIMPDMGGGVVYDEIKKINPDVKVLLSSGYSKAGQATEILARGCNGFIQKPFKLNELSWVIREILDNKA